MKVDCHIHSLCSDGIYTVEELIPLLQARQVRRFALTDHDTVAGVARAAQASRGRLPFLSGVEITCREAALAGGEAPFALHLLGYGFQEGDPALRKRLERRAEAVRETFCALCLTLTEAGYPLSVEEVPISCGNVLQLRDVEQFLQERYAPAEDLSPIMAAYADRLDRVNLTVEEALGLLHGAGGKAVWAHPFIVYRRFQKQLLPRPAVRMALERLRNLGLDGLEAVYSAFSQEERIWLREQAQTAGLFWTAGSDFHGFPGRDQMGIDLPQEEAAALDSLGWQF